MTPDRPAGAPPRIVIVGAGFAGLAAARALARARVEVLLLDRTNHHVFQPLLYQVATAALSAPQVAAPIRHVLRRQRNLSVLMLEVDAIDAAARQIVAGHRRIGYDHLILAAGTRPDWFGHPDWGRHAPGLKTLDDALEIRRRVLLAFERAEAEPDDDVARAWLTFAIIGGGPTGVELAGALAEIARHTLPDEFRNIDPRRARIVLVEGGPRLLPAMPPELSERAERQLRELGVVPRLGVRVTAVRADGLDIGDERITANTVLWAAGVVASPLGAALQASAGITLDRTGRIVVDATLRPPGQSAIHVAGDLAAAAGADGKAVPGLAPAAAQMGRHAARDALRLLAGRPARPFRYRDRGTLATIGRRRAVADLHGLHLSGLLAWWLWLLVHVAALNGFRNRLATLLDWAWTYLTYGRDARLILELDEGAAEDLPDGDARANAGTGGGSGTGGTGGTGGMDGVGPAVTPASAGPPAPRPPPRGPGPARGDGG